LLAAAEQAEKKRPAAIDPVQADFDRLAVIGILLGHARSVGD